MPKVRDSKSVQNRHIYSRISYLYQAAALFATRQPAKPQSQTGPPPPPPSKASDNGRQNQAIARRLLTSLRSISLKTQIRLNPRIKWTVCKFCDTLQIEGVTSTSVVENASRNGRKPWADVLVCTCLTCGHAKRYPVGARRQKRREFRDNAGGVESLGQVDAGDVEESIRQDDTSR